MLKKQERIKRSSSKYCTQYRSWVTLVSSVFPNAITTLLPEIFRVATWEWKILELVLLKCYNLVSSNSQGFHNMQFKSLSHKKLLQLAAWKFD